MRLRYGTGGYAVAAGSRTGWRNLQSAEREARVIQLRKAGLSQSAIAAELGISQPAVCERLKLEMDRLAKLADGERPGLRALELARLDEYLAALQPRAAEGDLPAIDRCLRIMERRARLEGLDAPERQEQILTGDALRPVIRVVFDGQEDDAGDAGTASH